MPSYKFSLHSVSNIKASFKKILRIVFYAVLLFIFVGVGFLSYTVIKHPNLLALGLPTAPTLTGPDAAAVNAAADTTWNNISGPVAINGNSSSGPTTALDITGGFLHSTYNIGNGSLPSSDANGGLAVGWNRTGAAAEVDFFNVYNNATESFRFMQKTGTATLTNLVSILGNGRVGIGTTAPAYALDVMGDVRAQNGWLRSTGVGGWFNETYSGGWYMQDTTWIRSYNSKPVYMSNGFDTGTAAGVGCSGGMGGIYTFQVCGYVGANAYYDKDNGTYIVDPSGTSTFNVLNASGGNTVTSDIRYKQDIKPQLYGLDKILKLSPVEYYWKQDTKYGPRSTNLQLGLIAQDVEKIIPEAVSENSEGDKSLDYNKIESVLIKAVQEQQQQIETQQKQIEDLKKRLEELEKAK